MNFGGRGGKLTEEQLKFEKYYTRARCFLINLCNKLHSYLYVLPRRLRSIWRFTKFVDSFLFHSRSNLFATTVLVEIYVKFQSKQCKFRRNGIESWFLFPSSWSKFLSFLKISLRLHDSVISRTTLFQLYSASFTKKSWSNVMVCLNYHILYFIFHLLLLIGKIEKQNFIASLPPPNLFIIQGRFVSTRIHSVTTKFTVYFYRFSNNHACYDRA